MEIKLPSLEQDPQWEKNIDRTTHHLSFLRCEITSWLLVEWRVLVFLTGWPGVALFFPGYMAFGLGAHPKLRERAVVDGLVKVSQERRESRLRFHICICCAGKKPKPCNKTIHSLESLIISLSFVSFGDIRYLAKIPGRSRENILVVNSEMAMLINAQNLQTLWTLNVSRVVR